MWCRRLYRSTRAASRTGAASSVDLERRLGCGSVLSRVLFSLLLFSFLSPYNFIQLINMALELLELVLRCL